MTGAAGLVYEVIWNRTLALYMGNTSYALATLLAVFMGGLAAGAWAGGRWAPRGRVGLAAYAVLEIGTGLYCALLPALFTIVKPLFGWIYQSYYLSFTAFNLMQFVVAGILLGPATLMMGATLPILVNALTSSHTRISTRVGLLYAVNAVGATVGVLLTGFVLLPHLGAQSTYRIAVAINLGVGIAVGGLYLLLPERTPLQQETSLPVQPGKAAPAPVFRRVSLLSAYAVCGFAAMLLQVTWTRSLTLIFGSSTYAFSMITAAFILGLSLGSWGLAWVGDRSWSAAALGGLAVAVGLSAVTTVSLLANLPVTHTLDVLAAQDFGGLEWARFRSASVLFLVPTIGMGAMFPIVSKLAASTTHDAARAVGDAYTVNTSGTILGAFVTGFVLIPWIGMRNGVLVAAGLYLLVGAVWLRAGLVSMRHRNAVGALVVVVGIAAIVAAPAWDRSVMTSGVFLRAATYANGVQEGASDEIKARMQQKIIFYKEGHSDVTTVVDRPAGQRALIVNGKPDAYSRSATQDWLGQLPLLLRPEARSVLLIGLGSGGTLAAIETHDDVRRIDVVELSPGVVEAARTYFPQFTGNALNDARARLLVGDGRLHLEYTTSTYDVIVSQPSNPWLAGAAALFTRESFELMRGRLNEDGLACIWFQGFSMPEENFRILTKTWAETWDHSSVWLSPAIGEYLFIGSGEALGIDLAGLERTMSERPILPMLSRIGMPSPAHFLSYLVSVDEGLVAIGEGSSTNTDDNGRIEFDTPKGMGRDQTGAILQLLQSHRVDPWLYVAGDETDPDFASGRALGRTLFRDAALFVETYGAKTTERLAILQRITKTNPNNLHALAELARLENR